MTTSRLFSLAWRQSLSAFKQRQWQTLLAALTIAIAVSTLMAVTGERIEQALTARTAELIGADIIVRDSSPIEAEVKDYAHSLGLETAEAVQFQSVITQGDNMLLVSVNAVSNNYPLRGQFVFDGENSSKPLLNSGELWVDPNVLTRLSVSAGEQVEVGYNTPTITQVINHGPAQGGGFTRFNPQAHMPLADLASSQLIAPGSRASYRLFVAGSAEQIAAFEAHIRPQLKPGQRINKADNGEGVQRGALSNTGTYLRLGAVLTLIVSALTILLSLQRYADTLRTRAALMMSFGLSARQFIGLMAFQLFIGGLFSAVLGIIAAMLLEGVLLAALSTVLPAALPSISAWLYLSGTAIGFAMLFSFGLAPLSSLGQVSISHLFSQSSLPSNRRVKTLQLLAIPVFIIIMWVYLQDGLLALALCIGLPLAASLLGIVGTRLLQASGRLLSWLPLSRLLTLRLRQQARWHKLQVPVISLLLALMAVGLWARNDLVDQWQMQLPEGTPNHFVINVQSYQTNDIVETLGASNVDVGLLPMVRGRFVSINDESTAEVAERLGRRHNSTRRALNLTWSEQLPSDNEVISGQWHGNQQTQSGLPLVSIEAEVAETLDIKVGDRLGFDIAGTPLTAIVGSIRTVVWESFQPNFYLIFAKGALDDLPATYITSFYLEQPQKPLINTLLEQHPTLTVIDIDVLLAQAKSLINSLAQASGLIMALGLLAGLVLVYVTLSQELERRQYENALLQTLGAGAKTCLQLDLIEMALIGAVCGLLGAVLSELVLWVIYTQQLNITFAWHWQNWLLLPLASMLLFVALGRLARKQQSVRNSYQILRRFSLK
ncbi:MAG: ABC transporter permease [Pontibacterium sp.]